MWRQMPAQMLITWNKRLLWVSGRCAGMRVRYAQGDSKRMCHIQLSDKILDSAGQCVMGSMTKHHILQ